MNFHFARCLSSVFLLLLCGEGWTQVCATPELDSTTASIVGIVNTYHAGSAGVVPVGALSISAGGALPVASAATAPGDLLMVSWSTTT